MSSRDTLVGFGDELWYINSNTASYQACLKHMLDSFKPILKNQVNGTGEWKPGPSFPEGCKMGFADFIECQDRIFGKFYYLE